MNKKKIYGHQELAMLYNPDATPKSASQQLTKLIQRDPDLIEELAKAGYKKGQRMFTPKQKKILFDHLGNPYLND